MAEAVIKLPAKYVCDMCKKFIEDEVGSLQGVETVKAEPRPKLVTVLYDEQVIPVEKIEEVAFKFGCHLHCWFWTDERYKKISLDVHI